MKKQVLGVIGGLGPLATARFMELVTEMTAAPTEQDNLNMIVYNFPSIPDRTGYILGCNLKSPLPGLMYVGHALARQKVSCIAIPCVTAHYFHKELQAALPVPVINGVAETVALLKKRGIQKVGIMATDGTIRSQLLERELNLAGIIPVIPSEKRQADVMHLIYQNVKAGKPVEMERFYRVQKELLDCGSEVIVLGCTELSVIRRDAALGPEFIDIMEVLAQQSILRCGKQLKPKYRQLYAPERREPLAAKRTGIFGAYRRACAG